MEIVLLENIKNLGNIGDVVNVKRGHGRNFLIKYGKALKASKENIEIINKKKAKLNEKNISLKKDAKKIYDLINKKQYKFLKRAKEKPFGSLWGVPAGKIEANEEVEKALLRELFEETAICLDLEELSSCKTLYIVRDDCSFTYHMYFVIRKALPSVILNEEHQAFAWLSFEEASLLPATTVP